MSGYLPHQVVKAVVFWVLTVCIVAATLAGILLAWGTIGQELARRCFWTAFILSFGSMVFLLTNYVFGNLERDLFGERNQPPHTDPAFAERLRKAKEFRAGEADSKTI